VLGALALPLLLAGEFLVNIDNTIVNVALPSIAKDVGFSAANLQWVVSAYVLLYGALLLLGGRAADLFGRRRVFTWGLVLFAAGSLGCGLSDGQLPLIAFRGVQGLGAAFAAPAGLSLLTANYREGPERTRALTAFGAVAGAGSVLGLLFGGLLTTYLSWRWVFFINLPIVAVVVVLLPRHIPESRPAACRRLDVLGAVLVTGSLLSLVFALIKTDAWGWSDRRTVGALALAAVLLVAFVGSQRLITSPLVPQGALADRVRAAANLTTLLFACAQFAVFFFVALYLQQILGLSALQAGAGALAVAVPYGAATGAAQQIVDRRGVLAALAPGLVLLAAGQLWLSGLSADGSYWSDAFGPLVLIGLGFGLTYVPLSIAAAHRLGVGQEGLAAGLFTTSLQVGGALGLAVLNAVAAGRTRSRLHAGGGMPSAVVDGFHLALIVSAALTLLALVLALITLREVGAGGTQISAKTSGPQPAAAG